MSEHVHVWEPCAVLGEAGRFCIDAECRRFEQITKRHFKDLFHRSFWNWAKEYADACMFGGYKAWKRERRIFHNP
jgi:hypothetical protein